MAYVPLVSPSSIGSKHPAFLPRLRVQDRPTCHPSARPWESGAGSQHLVEMLAIGVGLRSFVTAATSRPSAAPPPTSSGGATPRRQAVCRVEGMGGGVGELGLGEAGGAGDCGGGVCGGGGHRGPVGLAGLLAIPWSLRGGTFGVCFLFISTLSPGRAEPGAARLGLP